MNNFELLIIRVGRKCYTLIGDTVLMTQTAQRNHNRQYVMVIVFSINLLFPGSFSYLKMPPFLHKIYFRLNQW